MSDATPSTKAPDSDGQPEVGGSPAVDPGPESAAGSEPDSAVKLTQKERFKALVTEFGAIALLTYLSIFALTICTFAALIKFGVAVEGAEVQAGVWFSAWIATKLTQPARFVATFALTPLVATGWRRLRGASS